MVFVETPQCFPAAAWPIKVPEVSGFSTGDFLAAGFLVFGDGRFDVAFLGDRLGDFLPIKSNRKKKKCEKKSF